MTLPVLAALVLLAVLALLAVRAAPVIRARTALRGLLPACLAAALAACGGSGSQAGSAAGGSSSAAPYLYVASTNTDAEGNAQPGTVNAFAINSNGSLTPLTPTVTIGLPPTALVTDPSGQFVYAVNGASGSITAFSVQGSDGTLIPLGTAQGLMEAERVAASIDPSGRFLYVVLEPAGTEVTISLIVAYVIGSGGSLLPAGTPAQEIVGVSDGPLTFDASGQYGYITGGDQIYQYSIGSDGELSSLSPDAVTASEGFSGMTVEGGSAYAFGPCIQTQQTCDSTLLQYTLGAAGGLTPASTSTVPMQYIAPVSFQFAGAGSAYLLGNFTDASPNTGMILPYGVDTATGALTPGSAVTLNGGLTAAAAVTYAQPAALYVLSVPAPGQMQTGGQIDHYLPGSGAELTYSDSTPLTGGTPVAMVIAGVALTQ